MKETFRPHQKELCEACIGEFCKHNDVSVKCLHPTDHTDDDEKSVYDDIRSVQSYELN